MYFQLLFRICLFCPRHTNIYIYIYTRRVFKVYLPRQNGTLNETLIFLETVPLIFNSLIPMSFPLVEAFLKLLFRYNVKLRRCISFNAPHVVEYLILEMNFQFIKQEKYEWCSVQWVWKALHLYNILHMRWISVYESRKIWMVLDPVSMEGTTLVQSYILLKPGAKNIEIGFFFKLDLNPIPHFCDLLS